MYRRNVLMVLTWFDDPSYPWSHKTYFLRFIVTPTLLVHAQSLHLKGGVLDADFIRRIHRIIWHPNDRLMPHLVTQMICSKSNYSISQR